MIFINCYNAVISSKLISRPPATRLERLNETLCDPSRFDYLKFLLNPFNLSNEIRGYWLGFSYPSSTRKKEYGKYSTLLFKECFSFLSKEVDADVTSTKTNLLDSPPYFFMNWADFQIIHTLSDEIGGLRFLAIA